MVFIAFILMASGAYLVRYLDLSDWGFLSQWEYWVAFTLMTTALLLARYEGSKTGATK